MTDATPRVNAFEHEKAQGPGLATAYVEALNLARTFERELAEADRLLGEAMTYVEYCVLPPRSVLFNESASQLAARISKWRSRHA